MRINMKAAWTSPVFGLGLLAAALLVVAGCSSNDENGGSTSAPSTDAPSEPSTDTGTGNGTSEPTDSGTSFGVPSGPCEPGRRACASLTTISICNDDGVFEDAECGSDERCVEGYCGRPGTCDPGRVDRCNGCTQVGGGTYEGCQIEGLAEGRFRIPAGQTCIEDDDGARLVAAVCTPGATRCQAGSDAIVEACDECGLGFIEADNCVERDASTLCDEGVCISQCEFIRKDETYIGCEYWGLELDQAFVRSGSGFIDATAAPYAIIVSNTNDTLEADIRVRAWDPVEGRERTLVEYSVAPGSLEVLQAGTLTYREQVAIGASCAAPGQEVCVPIDPEVCPPEEVEDCAPEEVICTEPGDLRAFCDQGTLITCGPERVWERRGQCIADSQTLRVRGTSRSFTAYRVESTIPIVAYQFNPLNNEQVFSNDASLLYPTSAFGNNYWVMSRRQTFEELKSYVTVVAVLPGETEVNVQMPRWTPENPVETLPGGPGSNLPILCGTGAPFAACRDSEGNVRDSFRATLRQYEVLNISTNRLGADLTGARVTSPRQIAVFAGSQAANAPNTDSCVYRTNQDDWVCAADRQTPCANAEGLPDILNCRRFVTCCADHLEQQLVPDFALGRRFIAARSQRRGDEPDYWRVLATRDDTRVELRGLPQWWPEDGPEEDSLPGLVPNRRTWQLNAGEWFEVPSPIDFEIEANAPVLVGQFLGAEFAPYPRAIRGTLPPYAEAGTGDPAHMVLPPINQFRPDYIFLVPEGFAENHITITAPMDASVEVNGTVVSEGSWTPVGETGFRTARRTLAPGVHRVDASAPVGVMVHGYDSFVSYGYPAGMDFRGRSAQPPAE